MSIYIYENISVWPYELGKMLDSLVFCFLAAQRKSCKERASRNPIPLVSSAAAATTAQRGGTAGPSSAWGEFALRFDCVVR